MRQVTISKYPDYSRRLAPPRCPCQCLMCTGLVSSCCRWGILCGRCAPDKSGCSAIEVVVVVVVHSGGGGAGTFDFRSFRVMVAEQQINTTKKKTTTKSGREKEEEKKKKTQRRSPWLLQCGAPTALPAPCA